MFMLMEIALISLGVWQLQRKAWKENLIALRTAQATRSAIQFDSLYKIASLLEYQHVQLQCEFDVARIYIVDGFNADSNISRRQYLICEDSHRPNAPELVVAMDWGQDMTACISPLYEVAPKRPAHWCSTDIDGRLRYWEPATFAQRVGGVKPLQAATFGKNALPYYVQSGEALPPPPANNHFAYAIQWFIFAGVLAVIFTIWRRQQRLAPAAPDA